MCLKFISYGSCGVALNHFLHVLRSHFLFDSVQTWHTSSVDWKLCVDEIWRVTRKYSLRSRRLKFKGGDDNGLGNADNNGLLWTPLTLSKINRWRSNSTKCLKRRWSTYQLSFEAIEQVLIEIKLLKVFSYCSCGVAAKSLPTHLTRSDLIRLSSKFIDT